MSTARDQILNSVQRALKRGPADATRREAVDQRLARHPRGPVPARSDLSREKQVDLFQAQAETVQATVQRLRDWSAVPAAVTDYLRAHNRPTDIVYAPHPDLQGLNWSETAPTLSVAEGTPSTDTSTGVSRALAGVAETGTLLLRSGADSPTTLNFLPATHVVVLEAKDIVGAYEDAWDRFRATLPDGQVPRAVNLVTGPSRTADIEQTLQLGAHGPMDLHILVIGDVG